MAIVPPTRSPSRQLDSDLLDELKTLDKKTDKRRKLIHKYIKEAREKMIEERRSDGEIRFHAPMVDSMAVSMKKVDLPILNETPRVQ